MPANIHSQLIDACWVSTLSTSQFDMLKGYCLNVESFEHAHKKIPGSKFPTAGYDKTLITTGCNVNETKIRINKEVNLSGQNQVNRSIKRSMNQSTRQASNQSVQERSSATGNPVTKKRKHKTNYEPMTSNNTWTSGIKNQSGQQTQINCMLSPWLPSCLHPLACDGHYQRNRQWSQLSILSYGAQSATNSSKKQCHA